MNPSRPEPAPTHLTAVCTAFLTNETGHVIMTFPGQTVKLTHCIVRARDSHKAPPTQRSSRCGSPGPGPRLGPTCQNRSALFAIPLRCYSLSKDSKFNKPPVFSLRQLIPLFRHSSWIFLPRKNLRGHTEYNLHFTNEDTRLRKVELFTEGHTTRKQLLETFFSP